MRIKVEISLDDYEWDGRTLLLKLVPSEYTEEDEDPDPEEIIIEEPEIKLKVIGQKS
jgi:hypothetical protein